MSSARVFADSIETRIKSLNSSATTNNKDNIYTIISDYEGNANLLLPHQRTRLLGLIEPFTRALDNDNGMCDLAIRKRDLKAESGDLVCDLSSFREHTVEAGMYSDGRRVESVDQLIGNVLIESIHGATVGIPTHLTALTIHNCQNVTINATVSGPISMRFCSDVTLNATSAQLRLNKCDRVTLDCVIKTPIACEECTELVSSNADTQFIHL